MNSKILTIKGFLFICLLALFSGCEDDMFNEKAILFDVTATVNYPKNYNVSSADGVRVKLINLENGLSSTATSDGTGKVTFTNVIKGTYRLSFSKKISASLASTLGDTIVTPEDITNGRLVNLNASLEGKTLTNEDDLGSINLRSSLPGDILIKEVFYTGTRTPNNKAYYSDQFIEIFNNTSSIIYADSIYVATLYGSNGASVETNPSTLIEDKNVYLEYVWMIPGNGHSHPVQPGKSLLIAEDGMNHKDDPNGNPNSINLSMADFETFVKRDIQKDIDVEAVPNMTEIFASRQGTFDFIMHSYGPAVVLFKIKDVSTLEVVPYPNDENGYTLLKLPVGYILDAFEALAHATSGNYKRIPKNLDAGFVFCKGIYDGESCRRVTEDIVDGRRILQDTNNSSDDFEVISFPTPKSFE